jgi:hypothetical protein
LTRQRRPRPPRPRRRRARRRSQRRCSPPIYRQWIRHGISDCHFAVQLKSAQPWCTSFPTIFSSCFPKATNYNPVATVIQCVCSRSTMSLAVGRCMESLSTELHRRARDDIHGHRCDWALGTRQSTWALKPLENGSTARGWMSQCCESAAEESQRCRLPMYPGSSQHSLSASRGCRGTQEAGGKGRPAMKGVGLNSCSEPATGGKEKVFGATARRRPAHRPRPAKRRRSWRRPPRGSCRWTPPGPAAGAAAARSHVRRRDYGRACCRLHSAKRFFRGAP